MYKKTTFFFAVLLCVPTALVSQTVWDMVTSGKSIAVPTMPKDPGSYRESAHGLGLTPRVQEPAPSTKVLSRCMDQLDRWPQDIDLEFDHHSSVLTGDQVSDAQLADTDEALAALSKAKSIMEYYDVSLDFPHLASVCIQRIAAVADKEPWGALRVCKAIAAEYEHMPECLKVIAVVADREPKAGLRAYREVAETYERYVPECLAGIAAVANREAGAAMYSYGKIAEKYEHHVPGCLAGIAAVADADSWYAMCFYGNIAEKYERYVPGCLAKIDALADIRPKAAIAAYRKIAEKYEHRVSECLERIAALVGREPGAALDAYVLIAEKHEHRVPECLERIAALADIRPRSAIAAYGRIAAKYEPHVPECLIRITALADIRPRSAIAAYKQIAESYKDDCAIHRRIFELLAFVPEVSEVVMLDKVAALKDLKKMHTQASAKRVPHLWLMNTAVNVDGAESGDGGNARLKAIADLLAHGNGHRPFVEHGVSSEINNVPEAGTAPGSTVMIGELVPRLGMASREVIKMLGGLCSPDCCVCNWEPPAT